MVAEVDSLLEGRLRIVAMDGLSRSAHSPSQRRAFSTFHGPVEADGEPAEARALAALFTKLDPDAGAGR